MSFLHSLHLYNVADFRFDPEVKTNQQRGRAGGDGRPSFRQQLAFCDPSFQHRENSRKEQKWKRKPTKIYVHNKEKPAEEKKKKPSGQGSQESSRCPPPSPSPLHLSVRLSFLYSYFYSSRCILLYLEKSNNSPSASAVVPAWV